KTAMGADKMIPCRQMPDSATAVRQLKAEGVKQVLAVECTADSVFAWDYEYEFPLAIVMGNEALGIEEKTLKLCDGVISLPMFGKKESINVGNCAAAVLYAIIAKTRDKSL
ncbi:MAG: TrmH family RNA methyltransferase, partial [Victivallaceae bacterium]